MPHVILKGPVACEDIWLAFQPTQFQEDGNVYKVEEAFLAHGKNCLLLRALAVEQGFRQNFFLRITEKEGGGLKVGVEGLGAPERNAAVQRLVGLCAWRLMQAAPELVVEKTNIESMIREPRVAD